MTFRDDRFQEIRLPVTWTAAAAAAVAIVAAVVMLTGDKRESRLETAGQEAYGPARATFDTAAAPVTAVTAEPVRWTGNIFEYVGGYFFAISENRRLRREVAELNLARQQVVALQNLNRRYEAMLRMRIEPPVPSVGARIVTDVRGPYAQARLADAGVERGVKIGDPALTDQGLLGRVVGVARGVSRILLLTDVSSRTPVMVERTNARGILTGDGGRTPRLDYIRGRAPVKSGDLVLTSGDGGVFPRGLPVGRAFDAGDGEWRVRLFNQDAPLDLVRILQFRSFAAAVDQHALAQSAMPPGPPMQPKPTPVFPTAPGVVPGATAVAPAAPGAAAPPPATPAPSAPPAAAAPPPAATPAPVPTPPAPAPAAPAPAAAPPTTAGATAP
jgi:rod shape-determining protein MreC